MPLRAAGQAAIQRGVNLLTPFTQGNVSGTGTDFAKTGRMPAEWRALYNADVAGGNIRYVIRSYDTPIAWHIRDGWIIPPVKYSASTNNHQNVVRSATNSGWTINNRPYQPPPQTLLPQQHAYRPVRATSPAPHDDVNYDTDYDMPGVVADIDRVLAEVAAAGWTDPYTDAESPALALA